jgi:hypothetical protein
MASLTVEMCVGMQFADFDESLMNGHVIPDEVLKAMGLDNFPWMEYGIASMENDEWGMLNGQTILDKLPADHKFSLDMLS